MIHYSISFTGLANVIHNDFYSVYWVNPVRAVTYYVHVFIKPMHRPGLLFIRKVLIGRLTSRVSWFEMGHPITWV